LISLPLLLPSNASGAWHHVGNKTVVLEVFLTFPAWALLAAEQMCPEDNLFQSSAE